MNTSDNRFIGLDEIAGKIITNEFSRPWNQDQFPRYKSACKKGVSKKPLKRPE